MAGLGLTPSLLATSSLHSLAFQLIVPADWNWAHSFTDTCGKHSSTRRRQSLGFSTKKVNYVSGSGYPVRCVGETTRLVASRQGITSDEDVSSNKGDDDDDGKGEEEGVREVIERRRRLDSTVINGARNRWGRLGTMKTGSDRISDGEKKASVEQSLRSETELRPDPWRSRDCPASEPRENGRLSHEPTRQQKERRTPWRRNGRAASLTVTFVDENSLEFPQGRTDPVENHERGGRDDRLPKRLLKIGSSARGDNEADVRRDDELEDGDESFCAELSPVAESYERGRWLLGLLVLQSTSSFVLDHYQDLLREHVVVTLFLTMLVGAGGNAGNQSAIKVIRGLATGRFTADAACALRVIGDQALVGLLLGTSLSIGGFARVALTTGTTLRDATAISMSLFFIVMTSVLLGSALPFGFAKLGVDPAHAGTSIQVAMDIVGVAVTCVTCSLVLEQLDHIFSFIPS